MQYASSMIWLCTPDGVWSWMFLFLDITTASLGDIRKGWNYPIDVNKFTSYAPWAPPCHKDQPYKGRQERERAGGSLHGNILEVSSVLVEDGLSVWCRLERRVFLSYSEGADCQAKCAIGRYAIQDSGMRFITGKVTEMIARNIYLLRREHGAALTRGCRYRRQ